MAGQRLFSMVPLALALSSFALGSVGSCAVAEQLKIAMLPESVRTKVGELHDQAHQYEVRGYFDLARQSIEEARTICHGYVTDDQYELRHCKSQLLLLSWLDTLPPADRKGYYEMVSLAQQAQQEDRTGNAVQAAEHLKNVCENFAAIGSPPSVDYVNAYLLRANSLMHCGRFNEAVHSAKSAGDLVDQVQSRESPLYSLALHSLGECYINVGKFDEAVRAFARASQIQYACGMVDTTYYFETKIDASIALSRLRAYERAQVAVRSARATVDLHLVEVPDIFKLNLINCERSIHTSLGENNEAIVKGDEAIDFTKDKWGPTSNYYRLACLNRSTLKHATDVAEAASLIDTAKELTANIQARGSLPIQVLGGQVLAANGDATLAAENLQTIIRQMETVDVNNANLHFIFADYAQVLRKLNRNVEAEEIEARMNKIDSQIKDMLRAVQNDPECRFAWE